MCKCNDKTLKKEKLKEMNTTNTHTRHTGHSALCMCVRVCSEQSISIHNLFFLFYLISLSLIPLLKNGTLYAGILHPLLMCSMTCCFN